MVKRSAKWKLRSMEKCFMGGLLRGGARAAQAERARRVTGGAFPSVMKAAKNAARMRRDNVTQRREWAALRRFAGAVVIATAIARAAAASAQQGTAPVHISMEALHAAGGVPPGWQMALRPGDVQGGRQL